MQLCEFHVGRLASLGQHRQDAGPITDEVTMPDLIQVAESQLSQLLVSACIFFALRAA